MCSMPSPNLSSNSGQSPENIFCGILSLLACSSSLAFIFSFIPTLSVVELLIVPYVGHRILLIGCRLANDKFSEYRGQKPTDLASKTRKDIINRIFVIVDPTWAFFAACVTPHFTAQLSILIAPIAEMLWNDAAIRISNIVVRGLMHTICMHNLDFVLSGVIERIRGNNQNKAKEGNNNPSPNPLDFFARRQQQLIWRYDMIHSFIFYTIFQILNSTVGILVAATAGRVIRVMLEQGPNSSPRGEILFLECITQGLCYGAIFVFALQVRTAFLQYCNASSLGVGIISIFLADYVYYITRSVIDNLFKFIFFTAPNVNIGEVDILNSWYTESLNVDDLFIKRLKNVNDFKCEY